MVTRFVSIRTVRRIALGVLSAFTVILIAVSRYAVPTGLDPPREIPPIFGHRTSEIAGFVDVPGGEEHRLGISAAGRARLVIERQVIAVLHGDGVGFSDAAIRPGVHRVLIHFEPVEGGDLPILYFGHASRPDAPVPPARLSPRRLSPAAWMLRRQMGWLTLTVALLWVGVAAILAFGAVRGWFVRQIDACRGHPQSVFALLAFAAALFAYPLWWGMSIGWAQDELGPMHLNQLADLLSPGWHSKYPPMHMYVLAAVNAPILAGAALDMLHTGSAAVYTAMRIVNSLVSVTMALGITAIVYLCASRAAGPRVGVLSGLLWTLTLPTVYYAKTANLDVPYTFWFALALLFYQSALERQSAATYVLFALTATLAIVTKDQAYGLVVFPALHLAVARYRRLGGIWAVARDRAILSAIAGAVLLFVAAHNLIVNWEGFRTHVAMITGGASEGYRMIDSASPFGQGWLLLRTVQQIGWALSWPGATLALAGIVLALRTHETRARLLPFLVPAVSYYVTFIAVVGYTYDRFVMPLCLVLAVFSGFALDRFWPARATRWRTVATVAMLLYMTVRTGSINLLMAADSRYDVQHWMRANVPSRTHVVITESRELLPDMTPFRSQTVNDLMYHFDAIRPPVVVLSDNYRRRFPSGAPEIAWYDALVRGELGYRVALRHRTRVPLAIVARERQFRDPDPSFSILHKVNPEIVVLFRDDWRGN